MQVLGQGGGIKVPNGLEESVRQWGCDTIPSIV